MGVKQADTDQVQRPHSCILILGGSFDPVHNGHVALAKLFTEMLQPDELRIIPSGKPWQKNGLVADAEHRLAMLKLAFQTEISVPVIFDQQEVQRAQQQQASYTIDTLRALRQQFGADASLIFLMGTDQLLNLPSWHEWQQLFNYAHLCAASRPGFKLSDNLAVKEFNRRSSTPEQIHSQPSGLCFLSQELEIDISATQIRAELKQGQYNASLVPQLVLDYIQQHQLY